MPNNVKEQSRLTLAMPQEMKDMLKNDARSIGMTPSSYVCMLVRMMNSSATEQASGAETFINNLADSIKKKLSDENLIEG